MILYQHGISMAGTFIINDGIINSISLRTGGNCTINSGQIEKITLSSDNKDIYLTIGDMNETLNNDNPQIGDISITSNDLAGITAIINFYNGIIKNCDIDIEDALLGGNEHGYVGTYNIRPGYKAQKTEEGIILVKE